MTVRVQLRYRTTVTTRVRHPVNRRRQRFRQGSGVFHPAVNRLLLGANVTPTRQIVRRRLGRLRQILCPGATQANNTGVLHGRLTIQNIIRMSHMVVKRTSGRLTWQIFQPNILTRDSTTQITPVSNQ